MKTPSPRARKIATAAATPIAIVAAGALVWQASYAAFTGTTRNSGNNWSTGSVALTDDDAGAARFQVENMVPGQTDSKCIEVTANASVPSTVKGYAINALVSAAGLENYVKVSIEDGTGGNFGSCTGFVADGEPLVANATLAQIAQSKSFETGMGGWAVPAGTSKRTYKLTWTFDTTGLTQTQVDGLQGAKTGIDMQWEMRSN